MLVRSFNLCQNLLSFGFTDVTLVINVMLGGVFRNSVNQLARLRFACGCFDLFDPKAN